MRFILTSIFLFLTLSLFGQMQIDNRNHDFGSLYANAPTYFDFTFKNIGQSKTYLLTLDKPREVYSIISTKLIQADSHVVVRLKINDNIKGRFNYKIDVFFSNSNKPITLTLTGNVKEKNKNPLTSCPDFNSTPSVNGMAQFEITIKVIDSLTLKPIKRSKVHLIKNGEMVASYYTNSDGIIHKKVPLGFYYITATKEPYLSNYHEGYLNFVDNYVEIKLRQPIIEEEEIVEVFEYEIEEEIKIVDEPEEIIIEEEVNVEQDISTTVVTEDSIIPPVVDLDTGFTSSKFVPNNIVFIVDVSSSMNQKGKIDLLKTAMIELTNILRPQDQVSLIAYSGSVNILFEFKKGTDKDEIIEKVNTLKTGGYTAGGLAIKEGIRIANKGYIEGGNNLIFMVTDGVFNKGSKGYIKTIQKTYSTKGIRFSIVGIKTGDYLTNHLNSIATKGGGAYIRMMTDDDAKHKLFDEVKRTSLKEK